MPGSSGEASRRIPPDGLLVARLTVLAGIAVYGATIVLLKGFGKQEIVFFRSLLGRVSPVRSSGRDEAE